MVAIRNLEVHHDEAVRPVPRPTLRLVPAGPAARRPSAATYRRRRAVVGVVVGALSVVSLRAAGPALGEPAVAPPPPAQVVYVVQPGDSYWSIAATLDVEGDIRPTVDALAAANGGRALQVGDNLPLPR